MTAASFNLTMDMTSDATYRAWVTAIHNQISAMGWVQTSDTGQINLSTATRSGTRGANYEIWRTNDGNTNIYLKIEYVSTNGSGTPGLAFSTGFATDGAGNLTGTQVGPRTGNNTGQTISDTTARTCVISGSTSRLCFTLNMNAIQLANTLLFSIERAKNSDGTDVTNGDHMFCFFGGGSNNNIAIDGYGVTVQGGGHFVPHTGGMPPVEPGGLSFPISNSNSGTSLYNGNQAASMWIPFAGSPQNPGLNLLAMLASDSPSRDTTQSITVYGASHIYYSIGPNMSNFLRNAGQQQTGGIARLLMRYE
jgi:hypothetical protein